MAKVLLILELFLKLLIDIFPLLEYPDTEKEEKKFIRKYKFIRLLVEANINNNKSRYNNYGFIGKILFNLNMQGITYLFDIFNINITEYGMIMLFSFIGGIAGFLRVNFCLPFETIYQLNSILKTLEEDDDFNED